MKGIFKVKKKDPSEEKETKVNKKKMLNEQEFRENFKVSLFFRINYFQQNFQINCDKQQEFHFSFDVYVQSIETVMKHNYLLCRNCDEIRIKF